MRADGQELLAGTDTAKMYTVQCSDLSVRILQESSVSAIRAVAFGSRSDLFATVSQDGTMRVIDLSDYSVIAHARGPCAASAVYFEGTSRVITGWEDGSLRILSATNGECIKQITKCHRGRVTVSWHACRYSLDLVMESTLQYNT